MKKTAFILSTAAIALASCNSETKNTTSSQEQPPNTVHIEGTVNNVKTGKVYLQKYFNKMYFTVDSTTIKDGAFSIDAAVELPEVYGLTVNEQDFPMILLLDGKPTTVTLDTANWYEASRATGSALQDQYQAYQANTDQPIEAFIKSNPKSITSAFVLNRHYAYRSTPEELEQTLSLLDPSLDSTVYVKGLRELIPILKNVKEGQRATDLVMNDPQGRPIRLSDHFGQYVFLDFWASWCAPCRKVNPHLVEVYNKFHGRGLNMVAISLDKDHAAWVKAIKDDKLTWTHMSDLKFWNSEGAKAYGIRGIPANVLIDPNGIIIARNLHGDELDKKLEELMPEGRPLAQR